MKHRYWWTYQTKNKDIDYLLEFTSTVGMYCSFKYKEDYYAFQRCEQEQVTYSKEDGELIINELIWRKGESDKRKKAEYNTTLNLALVTEVKQISKEDYWSF